MRYAGWAAELPGYVKDTKEEFARVLCPAHADRNASLSIHLGSGTCSCFGCGWKGTALEAAAKGGWPNPPGKPEALKNGAREKPEAEYIYTDLAGQPALKVLRYPGKRWAQLKPDPSGYKGWSGGVAHLKGNFPLFNLAALNDTTNPVLFVEGEKDVLTARALGWQATTSPQGAGKAGDVGPDYWLHLRNLTVVLVPDQDEVGRRHMEDVARRLAAHGTALRWLELPRGKDLTQWWELSQGKETLGDLVDQVMAGPTYSPPEPPTPGLDLVDIDPCGYACTDLGNAELLHARHGQDIRYCETVGGWLWWDGSRWTRRADLRLGHLANLSARARLAAASGSWDLGDEKRKKQIAWALQSEGASKRAACLDQARTIPGVAIESDQLDADPWLLAVGNGTLDLRTGRLGPHEREHLITRLVPVEYDPDATCPRWLAMLDRILVEPDLIAYVQRAIGYSLTGSVREQCFFLLHGTGRNGKSTFVDTINALLGEYAQRADFETFLNKNRGDGPRNDLARLAGARFVHSSEADEGRRLAEALIKDLTGDEPITARFLHREYFDFRPTHKLWLAANHLPKIRGTDEGIWRRVHLIPFTVRIPEAEQDRDLSHKLQCELPGILAWAIRGCLEWQREGLRPPEAVRGATQEYREEMDTLGKFLGEHTVSNPRSFAPAGKLYEAYKLWAEGCGEFVLTQTMFGRQMSQRGYARRKIGSGYIQWYGLGLLARTDPDRPELGETVQEEVEGDDNPYTYKKIPF